MPDDGGGSAQGWVWMFNYPAIFGLVSEANCTPKKEDEKITLRAWVRAREYVLLHFSHELVWLKVHLPVCKAALLET